MNTSLRLLAGVLAVTAGGLAVLALRDDQDRPPERSPAVVIASVPDQQVDPAPPPPASGDVRSVPPQLRDVADDGRDGDGRAEDDRGDEDGAEDDRGEGEEDDDGRGEDDRDD